MNQILDIYSGNRVDFDFEKATGTDGVLIKGGQGQWPDYHKRGCKFIDECERVGLPWGIFWQYDARYSPESHKATIKNYWSNGFGQLGLWLACEFPFYPMLDFIYNRLPYASYKNIMSVWDGIGSWWGEVPGIYTSISKWNLMFGRAPEAVKIELATFARLWVAQYRVKQPAKIGEWASYDLWQYTENPDYSVCEASVFADILDGTHKINLPPAPPPVIVPPVKVGRHRKREKE